MGYLGDRRDCGVVDLIHVLHLSPTVVVPGRFPPGVLVRRNPPGGGTIHSANSGVLVQYHAKVQSSCRRRGKRRNNGVIDIFHAHHGRRSPSEDEARGSPAGDLSIRKTAAFWRRPRELRETRWGLPAGGLIFRSENCGVCPKCHAKCEETMVLLVSSGRRRYPCIATREHRDTC